MRLFFKKPINATYIRLKELISNYLYMGVWVYIDASDSMSFITHILVNNITCKSLYKYLWRLLQYI